MTGKLLSLALVFMLGACASLSRPGPDGISASKVPGTYYKGDGLGENISLELREDGTYSAQWHGCLGSYGSASGTWRLSGNDVELTPVAETDILVGYLRTLSLYRSWPNYMLARRQESGLGNGGGVRELEDTFRRSR
jgi:hypothetical protein